MWETEEAVHLAEERSEGATEDVSKDAEAFV